MGMSGQFELIGFVDDDAAKIGHSINGVPVYAPSQVTQLVQEQSATDICWRCPRHRARGAGNHRQLAQPAGACAHPARLGGRGQWPCNGAGFSGNSTSRTCSGEIRYPPDAPWLARNLSGKVVLVTGAGGSIGSELCRQIVLQRPGNCSCSTTVNSTFTPSTRNCPQARRSPQWNWYRCWAASGSPERLRAILPELCPAHGVPRCRLQTRAPGGVQPGRGCHQQCVRHAPHGPCPCNAAWRGLSLVSTDRAVRPTNVMGASKRMAELDPAGFGPAGHRGNLLLHGALWQCPGLQWIGGPPVSAPDGPGRSADGDAPEVTLFHATIPEAAQLVLQAGMRNG